MERAVKKYGWDNFRHDILCVVHSKELADLFEQHYISKYNTFDRNHGYNLTKGGGGVLGCTWDEERKKRRSKMVSGEANPMYGRHHSREVCERMSRERKGKPLRQEHREKVTRALIEQTQKQRKAVRQLDLNGNVVATYPSLQDAAAAVGHGHADIVRVCQGKGHTAYGFAWEYVDDELRAKADEVRKNKSTNKMGVVQLTLDGIEIAHYDSMVVAQQETGLNRNKIADCCHGCIDTYAGYRWKFANPHQDTGRGPAVIQCDLDGSELARFDSITEAGAATNTPRARIRNCCTGRASTANGFRWRFVDANLSDRKLGVCRRVAQLDADGNIVGVFGSLSEAENATGCGRRGISECCNGKRDSYQGFTWRYEEVA